MAVKQVFRSMGMKKMHKRGSALVLVMVASMFLIILTAGAFRYFKTNVDVYTWTKDRIQAKLTAEAGVNLAACMISSGFPVPSGTGPPVRILGAPTSYEVLPGGIGSVYVTVDPNNDNDMVLGKNAYMIRCISHIAGRTDESYGIESTIAPDNLTSYAMFIGDNTRFLSVKNALVDGFKCSGPFYYNGIVPMHILSLNHNSDNDAYFYSFQITSDHYMANDVKATTPQSGALTLQPSGRMALGAPHFEINCDTIPFGVNDTDWKSIKDAAINGGLYFDSSTVPDSSRMILRKDTLIIKKSRNATPVKYYLGNLTNNVVWFDQDSPLILNTLSIRTYPGAGEGLSIPLTLGTNGNFSMFAPIEYENMTTFDAANKGMLGLVMVEGYFSMFRLHPLHPAWDAGIWSPDVERDMNVCASLLILSSSWFNSSLNWPVPQYDMQLVGSFAAKDMASLTQSNLGALSGYYMDLQYDPRLFYTQPPFFPITGSYETYMWRDVPDITVNDVTLGIPVY